MGSSWKRQGVEEPSYHDDRSMGEHAFLAFTQSERNSLSKLDKFCQSTRFRVSILSNDIDPVYSTIRLEELADVLLCGTERKVTNKNIHASIL